MDSEAVAAVDLEVAIEAVSEETASVEAVIEVAVALEAAEADSEVDIKMKPKLLIEETSFLSKEKA